jgi:hypothetical protein
LKPDLGEEPRPKVGASSKEKALRLGAQAPKPTLTIHPHAKHGALAVRKNSSFFT